MRSSRTYVLIILTLSLCSCQQQNGGQNNSNGAKPSSELPEFMVETLQGHTLGAGDFAGRVLVVDFWATWCRPCLKEIPSYNLLYNKYKDRNFDFLGIALSSGDAATLRAFAERYNIQYPIYVGTPETAAAFGRTSVLPTTLLIDSKGNVVQKYEGAFPGKSEEIDSLVSKLLAGSSESG